MPANLEQSQNKVLKTRPPVVVIMGHVDHGKTSLLLAIRKLSVPPGKPEGVITQHIGAYQIEHNGRPITFLDTPGHEAFSQMRKRGSKVADIAVLVVAADEGVKLQTKEAISHIKKAQLPFIVAINKVDKAEADPERVKKELAKEDVLVESMGGKIPEVKVSASTGKGAEDLLELILLVAEMENLQTDILAPPQGVVIESYLDAQKGATATLILNQGKLLPGQIIGTDSTVGKIRSLQDFQKKPLSEALPSQPALVLGFEKPPRVGETFKVFPDSSSAKAALKKTKAAPTLSKLILRESKKKQLNVILKTDVLGSLEAVQEIIKDIPGEKIDLNILRSDVGEITETDVKLASHSKAIILGFRVKASPTAQALLRREKVKVLQFDVIYDLAEGARKHMEKLLEPEISRVELGKMKVVVVFSTEKNRQIVGGKVIEGEVKKGAFLEVARDGQILGGGKIVNLQRNKKDVELAQKGQEAGILYEGNSTIEVGDLLTIYIEERKKGKL